METPQKNDSLGAKSSISSPAASPVRQYSIPKEKHFCFIFQLSEIRCLASEGFLRKFYIKDQGMKEKEIFNFKHILQELQA